VDRTIDYTPLFIPVTSDQVAAYRTSETARRPASASAQTLRVIGWVFGGLMVVSMAVSILFPAAVLGASLLSGTGDPAELLIALPPLLIAVAIAVVVVQAIRTAGPVWEHRYRMSTFAATNGLLFAPASVGPSYPGAIFGIGTSRSVSDHFRSEDGRYLDFGNYQYVTGSGKSRTTHNWGFLALSLDRSLPHMVLDSRSNNGLFGTTNLPAVFGKDQVLSLEGDFDTHFTLYCPREYERDALYVFTPDLMALLIDEAAPFDVEIVDRWLFVYSARPFPRADATTYQRLLRIVSTVGAKTLSQTDRYSDERIGDDAVNIIAPAGRRLTRGVSWASIAVIAVFSIVWFVGIFGSVFR
jgi:hypothetical protein